METHHHQLVILILFTLLSLLFLSRADNPNPNDPQFESRLSALFAQWRATHNKLYPHPHEAAMRFDNFKRNVQYVLEREGVSGSGRVGLTRFADLSNEEFRERYLMTSKRKVGLRMREGRRTRVGMASECDAPRSLDWRKKGVVTPVKDQGSCGSCWAFSSTGAIEGINAINSGKLISLSEQELVSCDTTDDGCQGGLMDDAFEWVIHNGGIDTEANYPYTGLNGTCNLDKEANKVVSIDGYEDVEESESALLCAVVNQPVSVGIDGSSLDFQLYTGGIYDGQCSSNPNEIDHAVLVVGYGSQDGNDYWIVKNSWGTSWGMDGYIYIKRNTNLPYGVCAINAMASYPTQAFSPITPYPSPTPPSPPSPPPPPPSLPPPPPPSPPSQCGDFSYCQAGQTCCCLYEFLDFCLIYGCCQYNDAVCCHGSDYCCPREYPVCDVPRGLCLENSRDDFGVAAKKKTMAKHKFPWSKHEQQSDKLIYQPLQWRRNPFAAAQ